MKKLLAVVVVLAVGLFGATAAMATISGSAHDLSSSGPGAKGTLSSCQYCHTPHGSNPAVTRAPLWNRTVNDAAAFYTTYDSDGSGNTLSGTAINDPGPASLTCLSCHDGTLSVTNTYAQGETITTGGGNVDAGGIMSGSPLIGTALDNDHPVGFTVVENVTKAGIGTIADMQTAGFMFYSNRMECGTCHDPHGNDSSVFGATDAPFLRAALATICSDCHTK